MMLNEYLSLSVSSQKKKTGLINESKGKFTNQGGEGKR